MFKLLSFILILAFVFSSNAKKAGNDLNYDGCYYNGYKLNSGLIKADLLKKEIPKVPSDFTGVVICVNPRTLQKQKEIPLLKGLREGLFKNYDHKGELSETVEYFQNEMNGVRTVYSSGKVQNIFEYKKGAMNGIQKEFHSDGVTLKRLFYLNAQKREPNSPELIWNKQGQLTNIKCSHMSLISLDREWCGFKNTRGLVSLYNEAGNLVETRSYLKGKRDGTSVKILNPKTKQVQISEYKNGELVSEKIDQDNLKKYEATFNQGTEEIKTFFEDGKTIQTVSKLDKNGLLEEKKFLSNGVLKTETKLLKDNIFENTNYYENGKPSRKGTYIRKSGYYWSYNTPHGVVIEFNPDGVKFREQHFKNGLLDGKTIYYRGTKVLREEIYKNGKLEKAVDYDLDGRIVKQIQYNSDGLGQELL